MKPWNEVYRDTDRHEKKLVHKLIGIGVAVILMLSVLGGYNVMTCVI